MRFSAQKSLHLQMCLPADVDTCGFGNHSIEKIKRAITNWEIQRYGNTRECFAWRKNRRSTTQEVNKESTVPQNKCSNSAIKKNKKRK